MVSQRLQSLMFSVPTLSSAVTPLMQGLVEHGEHGGTGPCPLPPPLPPPHKHHPVKLTAVRPGF